MVRAARRFAHAHRALSKETPPTWANELRVIRCRDVPPTLKLEPAAVSWKLGATKRSFDLPMALLDCELVTPARWPRGSILWRRTASHEVGDIAGAQRHGRGRTCESPP